MFMITGAFNLDKKANINTRTPFFQDIPIKVLTGGI
jgi:hypothetical protein